MSDYIIKLFIGVLCMVGLAGIMAGSKKPSKPVKPEVTYVIENGKIVGAASSVPYTEDGNVEQRPVDASILEETK